MYINERDQINYHGFLRALREMHRVPQKVVCKGICTISGMNRFENGNRMAEKLMRDRLTARLGISGEKYEDYLQPREYEKWEQRLRIVKSIENRELESAQRELLSYEEVEGLNGVNLQFVEAMRFQIMELERAPEEELLNCISKAVKCTVSNVEKALSGEHLLADQEINLIAEFMRLKPASRLARDAMEWRRSEYEKLISYMDASNWENLQKAKVYPKVVTYICKLLLEKELTEQNCRYGISLCDKAIELLRDTSRLYYFIELTEMRRTFAEYLLDGQNSEEEETYLRDMLEKNNDWERVFKELYTEYKVNPYMSDYCYLYYETECHNIVEVIETRRKMMGLSRVRLAEGVCTEKTIIRFERQGSNPSIELTRSLFEKLGLCAEYRRAQVIVSNAKAFELYLQLTEHINSLKSVEAMQSLTELIKCLDMKILFNKQEIGRIENLLLYKEAQLKTNDMTENAMKLAKNTFEISRLDAATEEKLPYLTRSEVECVYDVAFYGEGKEREGCQKYIENRIEIMINEFNPMSMPTFELLLTKFASKLGSDGSKEKSNSLSMLVIRESLRQRRIFRVAENIYNIIWNLMECHQCTADDNEKIAKDFEKCINISKMLKEYNWVTFFQNEYYQKCFNSNGYL